MKIKNELLKGCYLIECQSIDDLRGNFVKTYNQKTFAQLGLKFDMKEEYFSLSKKNVLRGMHFQNPPFDHEKIVCCIRGKVLDVLLDIRKGVDYGKVANVQLENANELVFIPKGIAHGFLSQEDNSLMLYKTSVMYNRESDYGILWNSFGFEWEIINPIVSLRDTKFLKFSDYSSPFKFKK